MLSTLVRFSIKYSGIVIAVAFLILIYGGYRFFTAGLDIFPEFSPKQVIIQTESPGLSAEQVEILVTQQIETSINGVIGLKSIHSESIQGLSIVTVVFGENTEIYRNRQLVSERLSNLGSKLPAGIKPPIPVPLSSSSATVLTIGLNSDSKSLMDLRSIVDWTIVPRLLAVPGVADVNIFGGEIQQLQIQINPTQLHRFNLAVEDIVNATKQAGKIQGGGVIENENQRFTLQISGQPGTPEQFKKIIVKRDSGSQITLGDVAEIAYAAEAPIGAAQIGGKPSIVMMVIAQYGANTLSVSKQVETVLTEFDSLFKKQKIDFYSHLFRPADYIETSLSNLSSHLFIGILFVIVILYLFLFDIRTALISATAIPLSLITAIIILLESGINLNIMVLGGLAIALGEVVDDAIIDTENIFRRLRENSLLERPKAIVSVVYNASMEVRNSVVYASFIVALAFVPLLNLSGVAGRLFSPLGVSYILAILMSLIVALTLTPAMCYLLLGNNQLMAKKHQEPPLIRWIKPKYIKILHWVTKHFKWVLGGSLVACLVAILSFFTLNNKFLPELREGHYIVHTSCIPGTSLQESIRIGTQLTKQFLQIPGIESVSQWAGRAERGADTFGSHYSEYEVRLTPLSGSGQQDVLNQLRAILDAFPGILYEANTFLTERVDETISGYTSPVVVNVYGNDLNKLDSKAQAIAQVMNTIEGAAEVQLRSPPGTPLLQIQLDLDKLQLWGVKLEQAINTINIAYQGRLTGKNILGNRIYDIAVILAPELRKQSEAVANLPIRTEDGKLIKLSQIADIRFSEGRYNILRQGAQRKQTITCHVVERDMDSFMQELKNKVFDEVSFSANSYPDFTGAAVEQAQAKKDLMVRSLIASIGILIFIYIAIGNSRHVLITLANLPFSLIGGIAAVFLTGATLSVGSIVGFITLFGITVRNSIMMLSHYQHLVDVEGKQWNMDTVIQGAQERLPSILMTALVTALAMLPLAINSDNPGREIMGPMAAIIIGGLATSTLLNLLLLPSLLYRYGRFQSTKYLQ